MSRAAVTHQSKPAPAHGWHRKPAAGMKLPGAWLAQPGDSPSPSGRGVGLAGGARTGEVRGWDRGRRARRVNGACGCWRPVRSWTHEAGPAQRVDDRGRRSDTVGTGQIPQGKSRGRKKRSWVQASTSCISRPGQDEPATEAEDGPPRAERKPRT